MLTKVCKKCGVEKPLGEFHKSRVNRLGCIPVCKECENWEHRSDESKATELKKRELMGAGLKKCAYCHGILPLEKFPIRKNSRDGRKTYCYECQRVKALDRSRRPDVKAKKKERESKPEFLIRLSKYREGSDKYKESQRRYQKSDKYKKTVSLYNKNLQRRIRGKISIRIYSALKTQNQIKLMRFNEYLGCTLDFFMRHIESRFLPNMTWDNWGRGEGMWHIDHVIPCAAFDLTDIEQQKKCFHYTNQQPLWEKLNLQKNSKFQGIRYTHKKTA